MGRANLSKEHNRLHRLMKERGFSWADETGKGHGKIKVICPNGRAFSWVIPSTPSDRRSWNNQTAMLRRLLAQAGYPDERAHLRVASEAATPRVSMAKLYTFLDQFQSIDLDQDAIKRHV